MAKKDTTREEAAPESTPETPRKSLAPWQIACLSIAGAVAVLGGVLMLVASPPAEANGSPQGEAVGMTGFMPGEDPEFEGEVVEEEGPMGAISPAIFRLGLSFVIGFAVAYALRTFVKISLVAIAVSALGLFGLQYAGLIDVNWEAMGGHYDSVKDYVASQTSSFKDFMTGHLPSAGSAAAGLVVGFRKG